MAESTTYHLAQANIAQMKAPLDDPIMAEFTGNLDAINALAESAPGYVWRLQTDAGDATAIQAYEDETILFNMSVWETVEALFEYTYKSRHVEFLSNRRAWFGHMKGAGVVLWWVPAGHEPTVEEAKAKLAQLEQEGPTPQAFTFAKRFPPPGE